MSGSKLTRLMERLEVDRAVFYAVAARAWQFVAGPVTMLLIAVYFTPELQGYFYAFSSLLALQTFVELGMQHVLINVSSHEWSKLSLDEHGSITGEEAARSRLISLGRFAFFWYAVAALIFVIGAGTFGSLFFMNQAGEHSVSWFAPWLALVAIGGLLLWCFPFAWLLEGCHQVATVNRYRTIEAVAGNLIVWLTIVLGAGLWAAVFVALGRLLCYVHLLGVTYRSFYRPFFAKPSGACVEWKTEIWPMQWRLAIQGVFSYFAIWLLVPVMFHYHGAAVAGQMGMTWSLLTSLQLVAFAWVQTRAPQFGGLISEHRFEELDRRFHRLVFLSTSILAIGCLIFLGFLSLFHWLVQSETVFRLWHPLEFLVVRLTERLLHPLPSALFALGILLFHLPQCQGIYLRAHKKDPLLVLSTLSNIGIGLAVWLAGRSWGPSGAAWGYVTIVGVFTVPAITWKWQQCRNRWHSEESNTL